MSPMPGRPASQRARIPAKPETQGGASLRAAIRVSAAAEVVIGIALLASPARVIEALIGPPTGGTTSVWHVFSAAPC
jgi:hypothetical protein